MSCSMRLLISVHCVVREKNVALDKTMPAEGILREEERVEVCHLPYLETQRGGGSEILIGVDLK